MGNLRTLQTLVQEMHTVENRTCLTWFTATGATHWAYDEVVTRVGRLSSGLIRAGVQQGDSVIIVAKNRPEWLVAALAILNSGAVVVPLDTQIGREALERILQDSNARMLFTTTDYLNRLKQLQFPINRTILFDVPDDDGRSWHAFLSTEQALLPVVEPDDEAVLFYTSGTTGIPKGVPLTHNNLVFQIESVLQTRVVSEQDSILMPLPMYHVYPFTVGMLIPLAFKASLVLPQSMTGPHLIQAMREGLPTVFIGVPRLYRALYNGIDSQVQGRGAIAMNIFRSLMAVSLWVRQRFGKRIGKVLFRSLHQQFGPNLRLMTSGGSALDPDLAWKLEALGWQVAIGYGLTETSPLLTLSLPADYPRLTSVGVAVPGIDLRIDTSVIDEEQSMVAATPTSANQEGEILARGMSVFRGYRNLPDQTTQAFTEDGWFRTGDLGSIDDDGYVYISGRASTMIVTEGGKNIQPEPLEEIYQSHQFIREIGVLQDENRLVALIVPDMEAVSRWRNDDVERAVREAVNEQSQLVASYQRISDYAITYDPLPKTNLGKIRRHILRENYHQARQGLQLSGTEAVGPVSIEDMSEDDQLLLSEPSARQVWDMLAERYPDRRLTPDTSPQLDLGIDSLAWLNLTVEITEQTGAELSEEATRRITTVRDLLREVTQASGQGMSLTSFLDNPEHVLDDEQRAWFEPTSAALNTIGVILFILNRIIMRIFFKVEGHGVANLPERGPFVITPNHSSNLDPFVIAATMNYHQMRQTYWAGSIDLFFTNRFIRTFARIAQILPVAGAASGNFSSSLAFAALTLQKRKNLVWFPEGRLSPRGEMLPFRQGLGIVLNHTPVPVVPVFIRGTFEALPRGHVIPRPHPVSVTFGQPCDPMMLAEQGQGVSPHARMMHTLFERVAELDDRRPPKLLDTP